MLVLLAIVLVTASLFSREIKVNVPKASSTVAFKSDELTKLLTVTADKQLYLMISPFTRKRLKKKIYGLE